MNLKRFFFSKQGMTLVAMLLMITQSTHGQGNLVINSGFDSGPAGWMTNSISGYWEPLKGHPAGCFTLYDSINQTVNGLVPGLDYLVSGDFEVEGGPLVATPSFGVAIDGTFLYEAAPTTYDWYAFSFTYKPTASSIMLGLAAQLNGTSDVYRIDNISIQLPVPEPPVGSLLFLAGGALVYLRARRWRTRQAQ